MAFLKIKALNPEDNKLYDKALNLDNVREIERDDEGGTFFVMDNEQAILAADDYLEILAKIGAL